MPIVGADLVERYSGGASNTDPTASLGGAISTVAGGIITDNTTHEVWDVVSSAESSAGDTEYRCIYLQNSHGTLTLQNAAVYIDTQTPSSDTVVAIGLGTSAVNGTEQTVGDESTAPSGVTFTELTGSGNALNIGNIPAGEHKALWLRRIVSSSASAANDDSYVLAYTGDTAA